MMYFVCVCGGQKVLCTYKFVNLCSTLYEVLVTCTFRHHHCNYVLQILPPTDVRPTSVVLNVSEMKIAQCLHANLQ